MNLNYDFCSDFRTWDCSCTCKAGSSEKCKHIVASLFFVYNAVGLSSLSCTETTQTWGKRKKVSDLTAAKSLGEFCHVLDVEPEEIDPSLVEELFMGSLTGC